MSRGKRMSQPKRSARTGQGGPPKSEASRYRRAMFEVGSDEEAHRGFRPRATRNGLPDFKPYVYRGTGEDQLVPQPKMGPRPRLKP